MRTAIRLSLIALLFAGTIGVSASSDRREAERLEDTFAVLSELLDRPAPGQALLEAKGLPDPYGDAGLFTLVSDGVWPRESDESDIMKCLKLPREIRQELVADMKAHRFHRLEIPLSQLSLTRPYARMSGAEAESRGCRTPEGAFYAHVRPGYVYFNAARTMAAVRATMSCSSLGSEGGWQVFERSPGGAWGARPFLGGCTWVS